MSCKNYVLYPFTSICRNQLAQFLSHNLSGVPWWILGWEIANEWLAKYLHNSHINCLKLKSQHVPPQVERWGTNTQQSVAFLMKRFIHVSEYLWMLCKARQGYLPALPTYKPNLLKQRLIGVIISYHIRMSSQCQSVLLKCFRWKML